MDANLLLLNRITIDQLRTLGLITSLESVARVRKANRRQPLYFKTFFNKIEIVIFIPLFKEVYKMDNCRSGKQPATLRHCLHHQLIPV